MYSDEFLQELELLGKKRVENFAISNTSELPKNPYSPHWGSCWKLSFEYKVTNFAAEIGFFIDILGFETNIFSTSYAMFTNPDQDSFFSIIQAQGEETPTQAESIKIHFVVKDLFQLSDELKNRNVSFLQPPMSAGEGTDLYSAILETPHGVMIELWGTKKQEAENLE